MTNKFASGNHGLGICDVCGFQYKLKELKELIVKQRKTNMLACRECWNEDQPQLMIGTFPVDDPQALRNPRPDTSYWQGGLTGLQIDVINPANPQSIMSFGTPSDGSRVIQWGWNPVGLNNVLNLSYITNNLVGSSAVGSVTVSTT